MPRSFCRASKTAHVNFSVFHVGPTTESIRRELSRAQHLAHANGKSSKDGQSHQPFARTPNNSTKAPEDPFNTHASGDSKSTEMAGSASTPKTSRGLAAISAPDGLTPPPTAGPYGKLDTGAKLASNETPADSSDAIGGMKYPVTTAAGADNPFHPASNSSHSASTAAQNDDPYSAHSQLATTSHIDSTIASSPKEQASADLAAARQALKAGELEKAEKLTKAANALGVPESQYLPNEDRPSLVAWEIAQAKQKSPTSRSAQPTIERLPATTDARYSAPSRGQADLALPPNAITSDTVPAAYRSTGDSDNRQEPATLALPASNRVTSVPSDSNAPSSRRNSGLESPMLQAAGEGPRMMGGTPLGTSDSYRVAANEAPPSEDLPQPGATAPQPINKCNHLQISHCPPREKRRLSIRLPRMSKLSLVSFRLKLANAKPKRSIYLKKILSVRSRRCTKLKSS